jgi:hypothetical protein
MTRGAGSGTVNSHSGNVSIPALGKVSDYRRADALLSDIPEL